MKKPIRATLPASLIAMALAFLLLQGCEDDPILEPTGDDGGGGGSYGQMNLVPVRDSIAPTKGSTGDPQPRTNPEIF
jgi:hypothetical protein